MVTSAKAQQAPPDTAITLSPDLKEVTLDSCFRYIRIATGFKGIYTAFTHDAALITYRQDNVPLTKMLDTVLGRLGLGYSFKDNYIRLRRDQQRMQRFNKVDTLTGKVVDEYGQPLGGVSISDTAGKCYAITSFKGIFKMPWPPGSRWVEFTHISCERMIMHVSDANTFLSVVLKPSFTAKEDIVVTAYYNEPRSESTASTYKVRRNDLTRGSNNPFRELSGRVPGLLVSEASGAPGAAIRIQIRGRQSIGITPGVDNQPLNDPLVLLDKIPLIAGNSPVSRLPSAAGDPQGGGLSGGGISAQAAINPEDIESIDVLKDADATAIYGSRGAHGAIHITTRLGKMGEPSFRLNVQRGAATSAYIPQLLDNKEYTAMRKEALATAGFQPVVSNAPDLLLLDTNNYINVPRLVAGGTGQLSHIHASMQGGNTLLRYYGSVGYYRESSVMQVDLSQQRFTSHANIRYSSPGSRLEAGAALYYSFLSYQSLPYDPMTYSARTVPLLPSLHDANGNLVWTHNNFAFRNPLGQFLNTSTTRINSFTSGLQAGYRLWKHLYFRTTLGYQWLPVKEEMKLIMAAGNPAPQMATAKNRFQGIMVEPRFEYEHPATDSGWQWGGLLGASWQQERNGWGANWYTGYTSDDQLGWPGAQVDTVREGNNTLYQYRAVYGRLHTDWRKRYFLNATGRFDASSRFGQQRKMTFFGALGAAWVFTNEKWLRAGQWLTYGKFRASYGTAGNDNIEDPGFVDVYAPRSGQLSYGGATGLELIRAANPPLSWEKNHKLELALELEAGRSLFVNIAWYRNLTTNQLITIEPPAMTGLSGWIVLNEPASVLNTGWEFTVRSTVRLGNVGTLGNTVLLTLPRNRLQDFPGLANSVYNTSLIVGQPLSVQRGYRYSGVDANTGLFRIPAMLDTAITGHWETQALASWSQEWRLGRFHVALFLEGRKLQALDPLFYSYSTGSGPGRWSTTQLTNHPRTVLQRWQQPGDQALLQRFTAAGTPAVQKAAAYYRQSDKMMADASFWRIRSVYLGWELPGSWLQRVKVREARIYLQGQNLYMGTKYKDGDPSLQFPLRLSTQRTVTAGLQIGF
ncbi:MAG: SusC/RagA family TonB-linked outer membrane protein [Niastella sp.]|nr:SusC/RagA family TonB-linked outer membrane protein [Niastella sp.]